MVECKPMKIGEGSLAFMFETTFMLKFPKNAINEDRLDVNYIQNVIIYLIKLK